jgi:hypothetical protein
MPQAPEAVCREPVRIIAALIFPKAAVKEGASTFEVGMAAS